MERSGSQKALKVISVIGIIIAIFTILGSAMAFFSGGLLAGLTDEVVVEGMDNSMLAGMAGFVGIGLLVGGLITLLQGILGIRASNDASKINPVWILAIIGIVFSVLGFIAIFTTGEPVDMNDIASNIVKVAFSVLYFWIANNIKKQAAA